MARKLSTTVKPAPLTKMEQQMRRVVPLNQPYVKSTLEKKRALRNKKPLFRGPLKNRKIV